MKKLLSLFAFLAVVFAARGADEYRTYSLTLTNGTTLADLLYIKAEFATTVRTGAPTRTAYSWITNANQNVSATQIFLSLGSFTIPGPLISQPETNVLVLKGRNLVVTSTPFATITVVTQTLGTPIWGLSAPASAFPGSMRNSNGTEIVEYLEQTTNAITSTSTSMVHFVGVTNVQTVYDKRITNSLVIKGTNDGVHITNSPSISSTNLHAQVINPAGQTSTLSGAISGGSLVNVTNINSPGGTFTNARVIGGFMGNGFGDLSIARPYITNAQHYGTLSIDADAAVYPSYASVVLDHQWSFQVVSNDVSIQNSDNGDYLIRFEYGGNTVIPAPFVTSNTVTAYRGITAMTNDLRENRLTNSVFNGTNVWNGDIARVAGTYTALVDSPGENKNIDIPTNAVIRFSGAGAIADIHSFATRFAGLEFDAEFYGAITNRLIHNSGAEGTSTRRLISPTGGNILQTNQPATATFRKTSAGWLVVRWSN